VFEHADWEGLHPGLDVEPLREAAGVERAIELANAIVTARVRHSTATSTIFISRATADGPYADALKRELERRRRTVLLGDEQIRADRMPGAAITDALIASDLVIVLGSTSYALSPFCSDELELALERRDAGELEIRLCNLDGSAVIPSRARALPQIVTRTPAALVAAIGEMLGDAARDEAG
jgi:hypothetical protein